jgi:hypothetical protein
MKITKGELKQMIQEAVQGQLNEAGDFMSRRELLNKARDASFKFEQEIIKTLDLEDPNNMPPEKRKEFLHIARAMEKRIVKAVAHAIITIARSNIPRKSDEAEVGAPESTVNPGPGSKTAATPVANGAVTPHNRNPGAAGGM